MDQYLLLYMYDVKKISALKQGYELAECWIHGSKAELDLINHSFFLISS